MKRFKTVGDLVAHTGGKIFRAYWEEMRRHEDALQRIYARDKLHVHVPEEVGSMSRVWPKERHIISFYRCAICMKDLTEEEVTKLKNER